MTPSPEHTDPPSNLTRLYQQQRNRTKAPDTAKPRGRNISRHELGRGDSSYGGRVNRIYPREIAKSPPTAKRYSSTSPTGANTYNATTSPLLSALGATKTTATQYTSEWTKSLPFFANQSSPGNGGIAINGSPPIFHNSPGNRDGGAYGQHLMSNSPPVAGGRPLSHPNQYTTFGGRLRNSPQESPGRDRRASMYSHVGARGPVPANPPLPHQPQPHYYNLPDFDLGLNTPPTEGLTAGECGYHCGLDTLSMAGDEASKTAENVLLVGHQGGLDVFRVEKAKMDIVGRLEGLRGSVIGAKILPWTRRRDPMFASRPLIALILHGPVVDDRRSAHSGSGSSSVIDDSASDSPSRPSSSRGNDQGSRVSHFQTTVEVYSLKERRHVATLYKSPLIPINSPIDSPMFEPPPPAGDFTLDAKGMFVVVASGTSGEVFIFAPYLAGHEEYEERFRCIGKVWTSVQFRERGNHSSASSAADGSHEEAGVEKYGVPVFSLSDRWLAVTPPASSSLFPVNGTALLSPYNERPPGLTHHTVPPQPSANCSVDAPEADSLINRLTREGTQVAIKGARWATEKGIQAFKSYMNRGPQPNGSGNNIPYGAEPTQQQYFPPTHGHNQAQPRQETTVISIYDLQRLVDGEETKSKHMLTPVATIPAVLGCSFLSFSPSGLMLMTVSSKGDLQDVWDLKRMNFRRARKSTREQPMGPHVRQVARFARMTVTNVVDVVWSGPRTDKIAVLTDKGTVHMFLMPSYAFQWPPPRRTRRAGQAGKVDDEGSPANARGGGAVNSAMQAINGTAKPFFDAVRSRNTGNGSRFPSFSSLGMTPAAGAKSGKAVAAGVGKSINNIRHAGDNKLSIPASSIGIKPDSVRWLTGKGLGCIALVAGGILQIYRIQMRAASGKGKCANATSISKKKLVEFGLAPIRDSPVPPAIVALLFSPPGEPEQMVDVHGEWLPRSLPSRRPKHGLVPGKKATASPAPLSFSEIETNPPYQPFYTDRRVTRFTFAKATSELQGSNSEWPAAPAELVSDLHHDNDHSAWLFGDEFDAVRISTPVTQIYESDDEDAIAGVAARVRNQTVLRDGEEEIEQVVVTTRRRRVRREGGAEEEEGFFEDDCEVLDFAEDRV
ncbi:hypothetical protein BU24DRAFT_417905 [Aaosphaeria arxii CBS 175.79]|uniref:Uncharacterized protein n=1 Tax=Aaosphaeria arxii CBS 175.79 TaxID=1450172 RepID=A0A6A5YC95_9PLEO|nr:uncharacterized protein BU24DRAFT_417905 [Aaosphaeria arxii CBS 175.79]KAF2022264.1 hypothetical protein BU24DRAFT_417905 [Aaosphaeria arxii CBS 175.79]